MNVVRFPDRCPDPNLSELITSYCFGNSSDTERFTLERHLLECDACWEEVQRLSRHIAVLRSDDSLRTTMPPRELVGVLGVSAKLESVFAGHFRYVLLVTVLYAFEYVLSIWTELGYAYDRFGSLAWLLSPPVGTWMAAGVLLAFWLDVKATRAGSSHGLARAASAMGLAITAVVGGMLIVLPAVPTIAASFHTRTASAGYFKNALVLFAPLLIFLLPPFHAIVWFQKELNEGRHRQVFRILTRNADRVLPRGMLYLSPQFLVGLLFAMGVMKIAGANHMLDALAPGPFAQLFTVASYASTGVWFAIAVASLVWYANNLNELKREAHALMLLGGTDGDSRQ